MNICIICAKSNSKRVKNKNFVKINNKPIINFTIEAALKSKIFNKIYINTDKKILIIVIKKLKFSIDLNF